MSPRCCLAVFRARSAIMSGSMTTLRSAGALVAAGLIEPAAAAATAAVEQRYAIAITPALRSLIESPGDPIGRQFLPHPAELITAPHEHPDPIADEALSPIKGVVHRYPDRALLKPLLICPVYCRFCFRREKVGPDGGLLIAGRTGRCLRLVRRAPRDPRGHPHRRRSADAVAATAGLDRQRAVGDPAHRDPARPYTRAGGRSGAGHRGAGGCAGHREVHVGGGARQPRAGVHAGGARARSGASRHAGFPCSVSRCCCAA